MKDQERRIRDALKGKVDRILLEDPGITFGEKRTADIHIRVQPSVKEAWTRNKAVLGGLSDFVTRQMVGHLESNGFSLGAESACEVDLLALRTYADEKLQILHYQREDRAKKAEDAAQAQLKDITDTETTDALMVTYSKILWKERNRIVKGNSRISDALLRHDLITFISEQDWIQTVNDLGVEMDAASLFTRLLESDVFSGKPGDN